ncbi:transposase IS66, partial [Pseudomonas syringae pv. actinidiae ICMP 19096]
MIDYSKARLSTAMKPESRNYTSSRAQEVPLCLLESYRGYVMTDDYAGYNALALQPGVERLACMAHVRRKFVEA